MNVKYKEVEVTCTTWDKFTKTEGITHIDLLVLDIEGHEISVCSTLSQKSVLPDIICVEIGHLGLKPIENSLVNIGYYYDTTQDVNAYFIKNTKRVGLIQRLKGILITNFNRARFGIVSPLVFFRRKFQ